MTEFSHSVVLFSDEDGLAIEFNIQNTVEKATLKAMIEYGGGFCTLDADAIHLVSPGTTVINVNPSKKVISSRYIFDCVKQNYLLEMDDYKVEINEIEASDFSEENSLHFTEKQFRKSSSDDDSVDLVNPNKTPSPEDIEWPKSNHAFDFADSNNVECQKEEHLTNSQAKPLQRTSGESDNISHISSTPEGLGVSGSIQKTSHGDVQKLSNVSKCQKEAHLANSPAKPLPQTSGESDNRSHVSATPEELGVSGGVQQTSDGDVQKLLNVSENSDELFFDAQNFGVAEVAILENVEDKADNQHLTTDRSLNESPVNAIIVSSSQANVDCLDQFDNMLLNKSKEKLPEQDDESLSQSYTVSSSADAQVPPSKPSSHNTSAEIFGAEAAAPDFASPSTERQLYINSLEKEIEKILQKPSPRSIQDKIVLVKYICSVKKLPPAVVLQTLQNF